MTTRQRYSFLVRQISVMASVTVTGLLTDAPRFLTSLSERLRQMPIPGALRLSKVASLLAQRTSSPSLQLLQKGQINEAMAALRSKSQFEKGRFFSSPRTRHLRGIQQELTATMGGPASDATSRNHMKQTSATNLRVLLFLTNSRPHTLSGYTERSRGTIESLTRSGVEVFPTTRLGYPAVVGRFARSNVEAEGDITYTRLIPWFMPINASVVRTKTVKALVRQAAAQDISLMHTTTPFRNALIVSKAASCLGVPWIYEVRGEPEKTWLAKRESLGDLEAQQSELYQCSRNQELEAMKAADAVVVLSKVQKQSIREHGVSASKIHVVPNAVDGVQLQEFRAKGIARSEARKLLDLPVEKKLVGIISSLVEYEGIDVLLRAVAQLPSDYECVVVGDGTARPSLEELKDRLQLGQRVHFVGRKPSEEIPYWYRALDVFAVPRKDTAVCRAVTPIKPVMALALGCSVVASDLPPLREITGGFAQYVPPESSEHMAEGILTAYHQEPPRAEKLDAFLDEHTWGHNAEIYKSIYQEVLEMNRNSSET
ncbi:glycosyl transferase [Corynebacterium sp. NML 120412]|nr:glycosyl transferase [Corynebacterium sp. NML 120412]